MSLWLNEAVNGCVKESVLEQPKSNVSSKMEKAEMGPSG